MKILHIEDNESISEPMGVFLKHHGFEYESSIDGRKGLELIRKNHYDAILLDLSMPEFDGYDIINALVSDGLIHSQKIIIFTACTLTPNEVKRLIDLGVYSIHGKPLVGKRILEKFKLIEADCTALTN